jgi:hypothetical protein
MSEKPNKSKPVGFRLKEDVVTSLDEIAAECNVERATVVDWALEAYVFFFNANGGRNLTVSDMHDVLTYIRERAAAKYSPFQVLRAAEGPAIPEPGKIINPAGAGGADTAPAKTYPKASRRK